MSASPFPDGFGALHPFAEKWAASDSAGRAALRSSSTTDERCAFYDAVLPLLPAALERLDVKPLAEHGAAEKRLMQLLLSFAHVALAVEMQGPDEDKHTPHRDQVRIVRAPADFG